MMKWVWLAMLATAAEAGTFTYRMPVGPHEERNVCEAVPVRLGPPGAALRGYHLRLSAGSHHFDLYDATGVATLAGVHDGLACLTDVVAPPGIVLGLLPDLRYRLPRGVWIPWHRPGTVLVNFHAVNPTDRPVTAIARVALRFGHPRPGDAVARFWHITADDMAAFSVAPGTTGLQTGTGRFPPLRLLNAVGHFHNRGLALNATLDGVPWYRAEDWEHPPFVQFWPPLSVADRAFTLTCAYDNGVTRPVRTCDGTPCPLTIGGSVEQAMCDLSGYALGGDS